MSSGFSLYRINSQPARIVVEEKENVLVKIFQVRYMKSWEFYDCTKNKDLGD